MTKRRSVWPASLLALLTAALVAAGGAGTTMAAPPPALGPNVLVFDPTMPTAQIQAAVDAVAAQQVDNEFGPQRYALLFKPGTYGSVAEPLTFQVGYYTEVAGLGASPADVTINGHVDVYNRCSTPSNCDALTNFWRSLSNLTVNVTGLSGCRSSADFWAVSQASPMRRVNIAGGTLSLMDFCTAGPQFASGGFIADSQTGLIVNGSQQQFLMRDSSIGGWSNGVWNQVFSGVVGAPPQSFPTPPYTTLDTSPLTREKPFLYLGSSDHYNVFVPALRRNSSGTTWAGGPAAGSSIPIEQFFIAKPTDNAKAINQALSRGQNLIFTPGVYHLNKTIEVKRADTVVLGLGFPTLVPDDGVVAMTVARVKGVKLAGLIFDAGPVNSPALLQVGTKSDTKAKVAKPNDNPNDNKSDPNDPTSLHDVFLRIGGAAAGKATIGLVVKNDNVLLDDVSAWRADHGNGVGWTVNTADTGLVVDGADVTAYGLFVAHFQKHEVIWKGERGRTIMFQNEMPNDAPDQASWTHDGVLGYAAYDVAPSVKTHEAWGLGSSCFFDVDPSVHATRAFEVPDTAGVTLHDILTVNLGAGQIDHVVNDTGGPATTAGTGIPVNVVTYP